MANYLYVDNSNVWIEGMHVAAVASGKARNVWDAHQRRLTESWKMDFGRLLEFAGGGTEDVAKAKLYGSKPPPNDSLWTAAKHNGFEVIVFERNAFGKEKKVDGQIITDMMQDSFQVIRPGQDEITLVSGDADYVPTIQNLKGRGFAFHVVFWSNAAKELREVASRYIELDAYHGHLKHQR